jgi:hypothetical protein
MATELIFRCSRVSVEAGEFGTGVRDQAWGAGLGRPRGVRDSGFEWDWVWLG